MTTKFHSNIRYKHLCAKDYDIFITKIQYVDEKRTKCKGYFVRKSTGNPEGGIESFTILAEEYPYWSRVE
jgi:hypothetical protein